MKLSFPAMRGRMGKRDYFVAMVKLNLIPKLFKFTDWAELPPEQRAQRVIQKSRIPEITQYILGERGRLPLLCAHLVVQLRAELYGSARSRRLWSAGAAVRG